MWREAEDAAEAAPAPFRSLLRQYRLGAGLTQDALAERAGLSVRAIQNLERGERRPYADTAARLVAALDLAGPARAAFEVAARRPPRRRPVLLHGRDPHLPPALPPTNLPAALTTCIGREAERAAVLDLLRRARLVTLTGPGGCGKTRIALQVGTDLAVLAGRASGPGAGPPGRGAGAPDAGAPDAGAGDADAVAPGGPDAGSDAGLDGGPGSTLDGWPDGWPYPDGIWLAELGPLADPALVPQVVAEVLEVPEEPGRALLSTLSEALRRRRLLLVLDNCEHLLDACAGLAHGLLRHCPQVSLLTTGRRPLGLPGEHVRPVPPLAVPPPQGEGEAAPEPRALLRYAAVRLFVERAKEAAPDFALTAHNAPAIAEVCRRLDGLPLALELAAARTRGLDPQHLAARLGQPFRLLGAGNPAALPRQQTVRATVDWSHALLDEAQRTLFRRLSVFAGGWALEAAEAVCSGEGFTPADGRDVLDLMLGLVNASLVVAEGDSPEAPRYRLLETLRHYAAERLEASGEAEALRERHVRYYLSLAQREAEALGRPEVGSALDRLEREHDNLRAVMRLLVERGDAARGLPLAMTLHPFWTHRGYLTEGREAYRALLALPAAGGPSLQRVLALRNAGELAHLQADYGAARALGEESLALRRARGEHGDIAGSLSYLGVIVREQGDFPAARGLLEESLRLYEAAEDTTGMAHGHIRLGEVAQALGDFPLARRHYEASRAIFDEVGTRWGRLWHHFGLLALDEGDPATARTHLTACLRLHESLGGERQWLLSSLAAFTVLAVAEDQPERALTLAGAAEALRERTGAVLQPTERGRFERVVAVARGALGSAAGDLARQQGRALTSAQAVAYALQERPPP